MKNPSYNTVVMLKGVIFLKIRDSRKYLVVLYLTGFLIGIVSTNIESKELVVYSGVFSESFLNQYRQMEIDTEKFLWYVVRIRLLPVAVLGMLGCTRWKKTIVTMFLCWTGFLSGTGITLAILKMGVKGLLFGIVALTPQILFYIGGYFIILWYLYRYPDNRWNGTKTIGVCLALLAGIILETWVNPILMQLFIRVL